MRSLMDWMQHIQQRKPYLIYAQSSENFRSNITADVATRLLVYAQEGVQSISIHDEIDLTLPGTKKMCLLYHYTGSELCV